MSKLTAFVLSCLFAAGSAYAQVAGSSSTSNLQPATAETATKLDNCLRFYPQAAVQSGLQGTTVLIVHLLIDGTISNPRVARSSGHDILDQAAITCLKNARTEPKTRNGVALELDEQLAIAWYISSPVFAATPEGIVNICANSRLYPFTAIRRNHEGETLVSFVVAKDGTVKNVSVARSSGYPELDQASVNCVATFRYEPATANGNPVEYDSKVVMVWRLR